MATSDITNIVLLDGVPAVGLSVLVSLNVAGATRIDDGSMITQTQTVITDINGSWTATLEENANIDPPNTYYIAIEPVDDTPRTWNFICGTVDSKLSDVLVGLISSIPPFPACGIGHLTSTTAHGGLFPSVSGPFAPTGFTGATAATRYVGGTADVAPVAGTFAKGDFVISWTGKIWICTAAGTPGTWVEGDSADYAALIHAARHDAGGADALAIDAAAGTGSLRTLGTASTAACAGNDARLADTRTPATGSVVDASVNASAAIAKSKLAALAIVDADVSAISESKVTNLVSDLAAKAPVASPTFTGITTAPEFSASGLTGAVSPTRYVGGTAAVAPVSGTFAVGDFVITLTGQIYICTAAGTPGTWVLAQTGAYVPISALQGDTVPQPGYVPLSQATRSLTAARTYLVRYAPPVARSLTLVAFSVTTAAGSNDPVEIALYTPGTTLNRVATTGSTTGKLNSLGLQTVTLTYAVDPTVVYYAALTSATVGGTTCQIGGAGAASADSLGLYGATQPTALFGWADSLLSGGLLPSTISAAAVTWAATIGTTPTIAFRVV